MSVLVQSISDFKKVLDVMKDKKVVTLKEGSLEIYLQPEMPLPPFAPPAPPSQKSLTKDQRLERDLFNNPDASETED